MISLTELRSTIIQIGAQSAPESDIGVPRYLALEAVRLGAQAYVSMTVRDTSPYDPLVVTCGVSRYTPTDYELAGIAIEHARAAEWSDEEDIWCESVTYYVHREVLDDHSVPEGQTQ